MGQKNQGKHCLALDGHRRRGGQILSFAHRGHPRSAILAAARHQQHRCRLYADQSRLSSARLRIAVRGLQPHSQCRLCGEVPEGAEGDAAQLGQGGALLPFVRPGTAALLRQQGLQGAPRHSPARCRTTPRNTPRPGKGPARRAASTNDPAPTERRWRRPLRGLAAAWLPGATPARASGAQLGVQQASRASRPSQLQRLVRLLHFRNSPTLHGLQTQGRCGR